MAMVFTLASHLRETLSALVQRRVTNKQAEIDAKHAAEEEANAARLRGTVVTAESFLKWKQGFLKELRQKKDKEEEERVKSLPPREREEWKRSKGKLSGQYSSLHLVVRMRARVPRCCLAIRTDMTHSGCLFVRRSSTVHVRQDTRYVRPSAGGGGCYRGRLEPVRARRAAERRRGGGRAQSVRLGLMKLTTLMYLSPPQVRTSATETWRIASVAGPAVLSPKRGRRKRCRPLMTAVAPPRWMRRRGVHLVSPPTTTISILARICTS